MVATTQDLFQHFKRLGIETKTVKHLAVYTVEEAKALRGELPGAHSKNLFLKDKKGRFWLIVALEDQAIDLKALRKIIGAAQLSFGKPEALAEKLGVEPGSVTPFSVINDSEQAVTVVLDRELLALEPLNFHPLVNTATTQISADNLLAFLCDCGHDPLITAL
jgi:Ala-tRNA(Pro) deacylase